MEERTQATIEDVIRKANEKREAMLISFVAEVKGMGLEQAEAFYREASEEKKKTIAEAHDKAIEKRRQAEEAEEKSEKRAQALENVNKIIPERFKDARLEDFENTAVWGYVQQVLAEKGSWLCFGRNGVGKTRLAYALLRAFAERERACTYETAPRLFSKLRASIMRGEDVCSFLEQEYGYTERLIIDEIDKFKGSENELVYLSYLIDFRYSHEKQTVVFGNLGDRKPEQLLGSSIYSRLTGDGAIQSAYWQGEDRRQWHMSR